MNSASRRSCHHGLQWRRVYWHEPVPTERATAVLRSWAADQRSPRVALEARATAGEVRYFIGSPAVASERVFGALTGMVPGLRLTKSETGRVPVTAAGRIKATTRHRALRSSPAELQTSVRSVLTALAQAREGEELVLQVVLGLPRVPLAIPTNSPSSIVSPWYVIALHGNGQRVDSEKRRALADKVGDHGFACAVRLGVKAATQARRQSLLLGLLSALRTGESAGLQLRLVPESTRQLHDAAVPWRWPLRLNVRELTGLTAWPLEADDLPGQPSAHPKQLPPHPGSAAHGRVVAVATAPGVDQQLRLSARDAQHHTLVVGPTGVGKSALLANLVTQDIADGRAVVVIEPKGDLVDDILDRIPQARLDDVVVLDPADTAPVGLNPLQAQGRSPEVIADTLLATFKQLYGEALGPRSADILYAGLLTLAREPGASLVQLPLLLSNQGLRRRLVGRISDPVFLGPFWTSYESWSPGEQAAAIAPVMNKLRPLLRPTLRAVLGQPAPKFALRQVFTERKILLVPLRRGVIGPDAAQLLGSLVVGELWQTAQSRTAIPPAKRHPVTVVVDEAQDYMRLPTDLSDALAQARGLGVGFTLAHQFLDQLPSAMRQAVLANARSRIVFQTEAADAVAFAKGHPELSPEDFTALGRFQVYVSLFSGGRVGPYVAGRTLPPGEPLGSLDRARVRSRAQFGVPVAEIEAAFAAAVADERTAHGRTGRRRIADQPAGGDV